MVLKYHYRFEKTSSKGKTRMDCTLGTGYAPFDAMRARKEYRETDNRAAISVGALLAYITDIPHSFGGDIRDKADKTLTMQGKNVSSLFQPNPAVPVLCGDVKGTPDAIILDFGSFKQANRAIIAGSRIDVYIAPNLANSRVSLYHAFTDGRLDGELAHWESLKRASK